MLNREDVRKVLEAHTIVINHYDNMGALKDNVTLKQLCEDVLFQIKKSENAKVKK